MALKIDKNRFKRNEIIEDFKQLLKNSDDKTSIIQAIIEKHQIEEEQANVYFKDAISLMAKDINEFWQVNLDSKMKVKSVELVRTKFRDWLVSKGVYRMPLNNKDDIYVLITDNICEEINTKTIKKMVIDYVNTLPDRFDMITKKMLEEFIIKGAKIYFGKDFLDFLPELIEGNKVCGRPFKWNRDTRTHSFFYFRNCIAIVDSDGVKQIPYSNLYNFIWKNQIINREFEFIEGENNCDFNDFIAKISNNNQERYAFTCAVVGYLLHGFKDKARLWSIELNDEDVSEDPEGGNGKGLFMQAIGQLVEVLLIDGKTFSFDSAFKYQRVTHSTKIIFWDDIPKNFNFEKLFSVITEGIPCERKGKDEFYIGFEDSPKVALSTNYAIKGSGNSVERRKMVVEFSNYFSHEKTPVEEYGRYFFDGWDEKEWSLFDNFMIKCQQLYFKIGLKRPEESNIPLRKFINSTPRGFLEFIEEYDVNQKHDRKEFARKMSEHLNFKFGIPVAIKYVKMYCDYKGYVLNQSHSGDFYYFEMNDFNYKQQKIEL